MRLAVVGSTKFAEWWGIHAARGIVSHVVAHYTPVLIISGGAEGVDTIAEEVADAREIDKKIFLPNNPRWEPDGYKDRNTLIAQECTHLLAIRCSKSTTYGSGWTADHAERIGKNVRKVLL